jgi:hypothetical protein
MPSEKTPTPKTPTDILSSVVERPITILLRHAARRHDRTLSSQIERILRAWAKKQPGAETVDV